MKQSSCTSHQRNGVFELSITVQPSSELAVRSTQQQAQGPSTEVRPSATTGPRKKKNASCTERVHHDKKQPEQAGHRLSFFAVRASAGYPMLGASTDGSAPEQHWSTPRRGTHGLSFLSKQKKQWSSDCWKETSQLQCVERTPTDLRTTNQPQVLSFCAFAFTSMHLTFRHCVNERVVLNRVGLSSSWSCR